MLPTTTEAGSGVLSVATVTGTPEVFFRKTTTESEANRGELVTQRPTGVDFTYLGQNATELPLPEPPSVTEVITDVVERVTARPDVGSEVIRGTGDQSPTGQ